MTVSLYSAIFFCAIYNESISWRENFLGNFYRCRCPPFSISRIWFLFLSIVFVIRWFSHCFVVFLPEAVIFQAPKFKFEIWICNGHKYTHCILSFIANLCQEYLVLFTKSVLAHVSHVTRNFMENSSSSEIAVTWREIAVRMFTHDFNLVLFFFCHHGGAHGQVDYLSSLN